jgi:integrase
VKYFQATIPTLGCPYVIPARPQTDQDGKIVWEQLISLQLPWVRIREAAGLSAPGKPKDGDPGLHDLRRTFASVGADLGLKGFVGELLGHAEQTVTDIYTRTAAERLQDAAETIGSRVEGILDGTIDPQAETEARAVAKAAKKTTA